MKRAKHSECFLSDLRCFSGRRTESQTDRPNQALLQTKTFRLNKAFAQRERERERSFYRDLSKDRCVCGGKLPASSSQLLRVSKLVRDNCNSCRDVHLRFRFKRSSPSFSVVHRAILESSKNPKVAKKEKQKKRKERGRVEKCLCDANFTIYVTDYLIS